MKMITKRTRARNVKRFADKYTLIRDAAEKFVNSHCKRGGKDRQTFKEELFHLMDEHAKMNCEMILWCHGNNVDLSKFISDICIAEVKNTEKKEKND